MKLTINGYLVIRNSTIFVLIFQFGSSVTLSTLAVSKGIKKICYGRIVRELAGCNTLRGLSQPNEEIDRRKGYGVYQLLTSW